MKRIKVLFAILFMSIFILVGCSTEEATPNFHLSAIWGIESDDEETPTMYTVNGTNNELTLFKNEVISEVEFGFTREEHELENATVTDEEITIEYDGQVVSLERVSESVAETENNVQYQYTDLSEPIE